MDAATNFAKVTVDGGYDDSVTEIDVIFSASNPFPVPPFNAVWWNATDYPDPADDPGVEIVRVTAQVDITLTITRGQEGTGAQDHNVAGKTYKLIAGLTARTINEELLGDVHGSGTAVLISAPDETIELRRTATAGISLGATTTIEDTLAVDIGDPIGNNNSSFVSISDQNQRFSLFGMDLATDRSTSATGPVGTVVAKLAIRDGSGTIIGYLPIYGSIT